MIGAILGDIIGNPYEFDMGNKSKAFPLFSERSGFTDDTVMTLAVAAALMEVQAGDSYKRECATSMKVLDEQIKGAEATAIAGSIAEGFYGVPEELWEECHKRLPEDLLEILRRFESKFGRESSTGSNQ